MYRAPESAPGIERNHKVNKLVQSGLRGRIGSGKEERQVYVTHNEKQLTRKTENKGSKHENVIAEIGRLMYCGVWKTTRCGSSSDSRTSHHYAMAVDNVRDPDRMDFDANVDYGCNDIDCEEEDQSMLELEAAGRPLESMDASLFNVHE